MRCDSDASRVPFTGFDVRRAHGCGRPVCDGQEDSDGTERSDWHDAHHVAVF
jgi:hypothetical protein